MPWEPVDINAHYYWNEVGTSRAIGESCQYLSADRGKYYREYIQNMMKNEPGRKFCAYNAGQRPEAADVLLKGTFNIYHNGCALLIWVNRDISEICRT